MKTCIWINVGLSLILPLPIIDRVDMLWFMILTQQMRHGSGLISKRYNCFFSVSNMLSKPFLP